MWNRCDVCGKFIALRDFDRGAVRRLTTPDSHFTEEKWETLCIEHAEQSLSAKILEVYKRC